MYVSFLTFIQQNLGPGPRSGLTQMNESGSAILLNMLYDDQELQQRLASLEERISPGQLESDNDRLLLIQEKEQLLRELRSEL
jgi:hypothetical protein